MESVTSQSELSARPRRLWLRFGLRTFLLLLVVIAGWMASAANHVHKQRAAVAALSAAGGTAMYDYQESGPRTWSSGGTPRGHGWLRKMLGPEYFDSVVYVGLYETPKDPDWTDAVNQLETVKTLLLSGPNVTDKTLDRLAPSTALVELHLTNASFSADGLKHLAKFPNLRWLVMNHSSITDEGMVHLSALQNLEELNLDKTRVSNDSIPTIAQLPKLQKTRLGGTRVTDDGLSELRSQRPDLTVLP